MGLLVPLIVCHYLADFCLTMPVMIRAKAEGKNLWPIALHAAIHAMLVGLCLLIYGIEWKLLSLMMSVEWLSHFVIDTSKARVSIRYPRLADSHYKPYWMLYGFDQLLHLLVIVLIWYCCITLNY